MGQNSSYDILDHIFHEVRPHQFGSEGACLLPA
jgi:hypothetical protein